MVAIPCGCGYGKPRSGSVPASRLAATSAWCVSALRRPGRDASGRVAEWFKAAVLKTAVGASPPWVRIPPLPPEASFAGVLIVPGIFANRLRLLLLGAASDRRTALDVFQTRPPRLAQDNARRMVRGLRAWLPNRVENLGHASTSAARRPTGCVAGSVAIATGRERVDRSLATIDPFTEANLRRWRSLHHHAPELNS